MRPAWRHGLLVALMIAAAAPVFAQNLFEIQVFPDERLARGETAVEVHNVFIPSGTALPGLGRDPSTHLHLSGEIAHGWTDQFELGLFVETSPAGSDTHAAFTGWHVRPKYRFAQSERLPFHVSLSVEYAFMKEPGDTSFRQAIAVVPILEHHHEAFEMSFNPGVDVVVTGPSIGSTVFAPSARVAWGPTANAWIGAEYYAETGPIKHVEPLAAQHHLLFSTIDLRTPSRWGLNIGVGRGLTGGTEHWVVKSIVSMTLSDFGR